MFEELTLIRPDDPRYDDVRAVWNGMIDRRPAAIALCRDARDVRAALALAREEEVPVTVRGGGHNVAGSALADGALVVDLAALDSVEVDPIARTVRVGGGATWGALDRAAQGHGLATPGGVISSTGVGGLTLGGGLSWQRRAHGMTIDNLLAADVVTADGRLVRASEEENPDLLWALRGGGGGFGAVTSFEFRAHELGPQVMFAETMYPAGDARTVLEAYRDYVAAAPDEVTVDAALWSFPHADELPADVQGKPFAGIFALHVGPVDEAARVLQPLREIAAPLVDLSGERLYAELQAENDVNFPAQQRYYWKAHYVDELADGLVDRLVELEASRPTPQTLIFVRSLGGAIDRVAPDATAFAARGARYLVSLDAAWTRPADTERVLEWTREAWESLRPFSRGQTYLNLHAADGADDAVRASFAGNYDRLERVRAAYDPDGLFAGARAVALV